MTVEPLRILFVNRMAAMVRGGGETFDLEMARNLAQLGCEVTFLTGLPVFGRAKLGPQAWWGDAIANSQLRISDFHLRTPYLGWFPWDKTPGGWRIRVADFKLFESAAARWAFRRRAQFDVIHVCELPFFVDDYKRLESRVAPPASRIPVCMRLTAPDFYDPHGALRRADAVIASGTTMQAMQAGPRPDCVNIPNGVDTNLFRPHATDFRARMGWAVGDFVVLSVARFQTVKNHAMLVEAFRLLAEALPHARLALAGSGPLEASVRARCAASGVGERVTFLGEMPFDQVADLYAAADAVAISSDYESFSFVALEAMATGLPVVSTATGWVPTLIGGAAHEPALCAGGRVTPVGDARAFADALLELARNPQRRAEQGAWNRARVVREFGWPASAARVKALYASLAASRGERKSG